MALSRDAIIAADDIKTREVDMPEWGGSVFVKGVTGAERDNFEAANQDSSGNAKLTNLRARFLVRCIVNEQGTRIFADQDAAALGKKSSAAINRLWEVAGELNGTKDSDQEAMEGNSEATGADTADGDGSSSL